MHSPQNQYTHQSCTAFEPRDWNLDINMAVLSPSEADDAPHSRDMHIADAPQVRFPRAKVRDDSHPLSPVRSHFDRVLSVSTIATFGHRLPSSMNWESSADQIGDLTDCVLVTAGFGEEEMNALRYNRVGAQRSSGWWRSVEIGWSMQCNS